jgi:hypothetical protein
MIGRNQHAGARRSLGRAVDVGTLSTNERNPEDHTSRSGGIHFVTRNFHRNEKNR